MDSLLLPITQPCFVLLSIPLSEHSWPLSLVLQGESCLGDSSTWEDLFIPNPHLHSTPLYLVSRLLPGSWGEAAVASLASTQTLG